MTKDYGYYPFVVICALLIISAGCAGSSASSHFYTLSSSGLKQTSASASTGPVVRIAVGPVAIPDYLRRPQIVSRTGQNELRIDEFERWAGALEDDVTRVLVENLSTLLPAERATVFPWKPSLQTSIPFDCRISADVTRFEGTPGNTVILKALWSITQKDGRDASVVKESIVIRKVDGVGYPALVDAMSTAVTDLSREMAGGMKDAGILP